MSEYFRKPKSSGGNVKVKLVLSNYAKKWQILQMQQVDIMTYRFRYEK